MNLKKWFLIAAAFLLVCQPAYAAKRSTNSPSYFTSRGKTSLGTFSAAETIRVTATIAPVFSLTVEVVGGGDALDFGVVGHGESPPRKELVIGMRTNLKRPFQIMQESFGPLTNEAGDMIPEDRFTCVTYGFTGNKTACELGAKVPTPITEEPLVLFISDEKGSQDYFTVGYDVAPPQGQKYGEYKTVLTYTATLL